VRFGCEVAHQWHVDRVVGRGTTLCARHCPHPFQVPHGCLRREGNIQGLLSCSSSEFSFRARSSSNQQRKRIRHQHQHSQEPFFSFVAGTFRIFNAEKAMKYSRFPNRAIYRLATEPHPLISSRLSRAINLIEFCLKQRSRVNISSCPWRL
jgi:hypothetical protein